MKHVAVVVAMVLVCWSASAVDAVQCSPKRDTKGHIVRSAQQVRAFERANPCPSTGLTSGKCPGYIVDHKISLYFCGDDSPANMQWQSIAKAKAKDKWENKRCRDGKVN